jgi:hypothetical protein
MAVDDLEEVLRELRMMRRNADPKRPGNLESFSREPESAGWPPGLG